MQLQRNLIKTDETFKKKRKTCATIKCLIEQRICATAAWAWYVRNEL